MGITNWLHSLSHSRRIKPKIRPRSRRRLLPTSPVSCYVESLEERQMLSGTALTFDAVSDGDPNEFVLRRNGDNVELLRNNAVVRSQAAAETNAAIINGVNGQADSLTVDFRTGGGLNLSEGIRFDGGDGADDRLVIQDSSAADSFVLSGNSISNGSTPITVENVERIFIDVSADGPDQVRVDLPFTQSGQLPTIQLLASTDGTDTLRVDSAADNDSFLTNLDGTLTTVDPNSLNFVDSIRDGAFQSDGRIDGLNGAASVALSPDGNDAFVVSQISDAITLFRRDPQTGQFRVVETLVDGQTQGQNTIDGLNGASSVAVSPDGLNVFVTGRNDDAVAVFRRDPNTGNLTFVEVQRDGEGGVTRLNAPTSVVVSPDGNSVIVAAESDSALTIFRRDAATGALTFVQTVRDNRDGVDGLAGASFVTFSPDGRSVYAAGTRDDSVAVFSRDVVSGELTFLQSLRDGTNGIDGLEDVSSIAVTADGRNVFATGSNRNENALVLFSRDTQTGELTFLDVIRDGDQQNGQTVDGLGQASSVAVSNDGRFVFVTGQRDDALAVFERDPSSGQLTFREVLRDLDVEKVTNIDGRTRRETIDILNGVGSVIVSPDGQFVLTASSTADALAVFQLDTGTGQIDFSDSFVDGELLNAIEVTGLDDPRSIAVSPNGNNVIVVSSQSNSITVFQRDAETGTLSFLQTIADDDDNDVFGLLGARSVTITPDGNNVIVASGISDAIAIFSRDRETGLLSFLETQRSDALNGAASVTVSQDGRSVFVVAGFSDTLVVFDRDVNSGRLVQRQVFQDQRVSRSRRIDGADLVDGLDSADLVTVSPDGRSVYVVSSQGDDTSLVVFERDLTSGQLSFVEVQENIPGLQDARSITVSPDGRNVLAVGNDNDALLVFTRDQQSGTLTLLQTLTDENQGGTVNGLDGASSVTISPDGNLVFVTADRDDALTVFRRDLDTGELVFIQRINDDNNGLDGATIAVVSPDGRFIDTLSRSDRTVSVFEVQQINSAPIITSDSRPFILENQTQVLTVTASDVDGLGQAATFSITGGDDAGSFAINAETGELTFNEAPNFETRADADGDNIFEVEVTADDGNGGRSTQLIRVTIWNVNEDPVITSDSRPFILENQSEVLTVTTSDEDLSAQIATFAITGGDDAGSFSINAQTGELTFDETPDFEAPGDADGDNVFEVEVTADDGNGGRAVQLIRVTIWNVDEIPEVTADGVVFDEINSSRRFSIFTATNSTLELRRPSTPDNVVIPIATDVGFQQPPVTTDNSADLTDGDFDPAPFVPPTERAAIENVPEDQARWDEFWRNVGLSLRNFSESVSDLGDVMPFLTVTADANPRRDAEIYDESESGDESIVARSAASSRNVETAAQTERSNLSSVISAVQHWWNTVARKLKGQSDPRAEDALDRAANQQASVAAGTASVATSR